MPCPRIADRTFEVSVPTEQGQVLTSPPILVQAFLVHTVPVAILAAHDAPHIAPQPLASTHDVTTDLLANAETDSLHDYADHDELFAHLQEAEGWSTPSPIDPGYAGDSDE